MKSQDVYGEPRVFKFPGLTAYVYQPILTDEERARRMKRIVPRFVVGIPVAFAIFRFADVMPNALFQLKDKPGINFFLAITVILSTFTQPLASVLRL